MSPEGGICGERMGTGSVVGEERGSGLVIEGEVIGSILIGGGGGMGSATYEGAMDSGSGGEKIME